jgi:hypothetical protein
VERFFRNNYENYGRYLEIGWYNVHESNEQCEIRQAKNFVVLAHKKFFACLIS